MCPSPSTTIKENKIKYFKKKAYFSRTVKSLIINLYQIQANWIKGEKANQVIYVVA
jgi:hypothetical protein